MEVMLKNPELNYEKKEKVEVELEKEVLKRKHKY